jgi:hypothetical protein
MYVCTSLSFYGVAAHKENRKTTDVTAAAALANLNSARQHKPTKDGIAAHSFRFNNVSFFFCSFTVGVLFLSFFHTCEEHG